MLGGLITRPPAPAPASSLRLLACADLEIVRMHLVVVIGLLTNFAGNPLKIQCTAVETVDQAKTCLAFKNLVKLAWGRELSWLVLACFGVRYLKQRSCSKIWFVTKRGVQWNEGTSRFQTFQKQIFVISFTFTWMKKKCLPEKPQVFIDSKMSTIDIG